MIRRLRAHAGQTAAEYMGVLLVVSVIIAAVATTSVGTQIEREMRRIVCEIFGGDCGDAPKAPGLSPCVVSEATDKVTINGEFDVKLWTVKVEGGVEYTRQKRANGEVGVTFKLSQSGGIGKKIKEYLDASIKGGPASSVTFVLPDDAAANRFAQQIKDSAKALALKAVTRFAGGEDPHIDFPPVESVSFEQTAGVNVTAGIDEQGGYANGSVEPGIALGFKKDMTQGKPNSGDTTAYYKINAKGTGAAGTPLVGPGYTGALAGELTLAVTWDKDWNAKKLSLTGSGGYEGGMELKVHPQDLRAALRQIDAIDLKHNARSGRKVQFQIDLNLTDATERQLALTFLRAATPGNQAAAGYQLWQLVERKGEIQVRDYDTDASTSSVGLETPLASGGIAYDTTSAELTSAKDYKPGQGFVPSVVCRR